MVVLIEPFLYHLKIAKIEVIINFKS
jgi:hypothetical protein